MTRICGSSFGINECRSGSGILINPQCIGSSGRLEIKIRTRVFSRDRAVARILNTSLMPLSWSHSSSASITNRSGEGDILTSKLENDSIIKHFYCSRRDCSVRISVSYDRIADVASGLRDGFCHLSSKACNKVPRCYLYLCSRYPLRNTLVHLRQLFPRRIVS